MCRARRQAAWSSSPPARAARRRANRTTPCGARPRAATPPASTVRTAPTAARAALAAACQYEPGGCGRWMVSQCSCRLSRLELLAELPHGRLEGADLRAVVGTRGHERRLRTGRHPFEILP